MGLFDFLNKTKVAAPPVRTSPVDRPDADISKTYIVAQLLKTPREERDDAWYQQFYSNVTTASFAASSPQVLTGPDGFPYFILNTPEVNMPFESFCIKNMTEDFLLERGWGIVFNPKEDKSADWVFTYGNVVNLHLTGHFFSPVEEESLEGIQFTKTSGVITTDQKVMIAQPSEDYLPATTRNALKFFLRSKGIKQPKVMMLSSVAGNKVIRKLAFNIDPQNYSAAGNLDYLMQQVGWFLPNDYILIPLPANSELASGFNLL